MVSCGISFDNVLRFHSHLVRPLRLFIDSRTLYIPAFRGVCTTDTAPSTCDINFLLRAIPLSPADWNHPPSSNWPDLAHIPAVQIYVTIKISAGRRADVARLRRRLKRSAKRKRKTIHACFWRQHTDRYDINALRRQGFR